MNIVVVGAQYPDTLARCVLETLKDMGHNVYSVDERKLLLSARLPTRYYASKWTIKIRRIEDFLMRLSPKFEIYVYNRLCQMIKPCEPHLIITHSAWIPPETISRLKQATGATIVCWFPDHPGNLGREYILAGDYDALFFKDLYLVELARKINKNAFYLPQCCCSIWHRRVELTEQERQFYECDITIAGNFYYFRAKILENLIEDYKVKIWGPPTPRWLKSPCIRVHQNHYVAELEKSKAFNAAKIVLNTFQPGEFRGVNKRVFEAAGCGAFQICEYRLEIEDLFTVGEEMVVYHSLKDLREKIDYYLTHPEERMAIADKACKRAHKEHTYENRVKKILETVKLLRTKR